MKNYLFLFGLLLTSSLFAQKTIFNLQKKHVAEGYDVVAYFDNSAEKGSKTYKTTYEGANFLFKSQKNLETFKKNPEKYAPQYGGYCSYAMSKGKKASVDPETFEIRNGKLYLFYNSWGTNTLKSWKKEDPEKLVVKANKNWLKFI